MECRGKLRETLYLNTATSRNYQNAIIPEYVDIKTQANFLDLLYDMQEGDMPADCAKNAGALEIYDENNNRVVKEWGTSAGYIPITESEVKIYSLAKSDRDHGLKWGHTEKELFRRALNKNPGNIFNFKEGLREPKYLARVDGRDKILDEKYQLIRNAPLYKKHLTDLNCRINMLSEQPICVWGNSSSEDPDCFQFINTAYPEGSKVGYLVDYDTFAKSDVRQDQVNQLRNALKSLNLPTKSHLQQDIVCVPVSHFTLEDMEKEFCNLQISEKTTKF